MEDAVASQTPTPAPTEAATIDRRRKELRETVRQHHRWYSSAKSLNRNLYYGFQVLSLVSGFGAAALAAIDPPFAWSRPALILLPLLASTFASLIHQFSWRELYELREQGRIDMEELLFETKRSRPDTTAAMTELEGKTHAKMIATSRLQAAGYFSFVKSRDADDPKTKTD